MADLPIIQHFKISSIQAKILREIARRGGEMDWDARQIADRPDVQALAHDLLERRIVKLVEYVTRSMAATGAPGRTFMKLTDLGVRIVSKLEESDKNKVQVTAQA